MRLELLKTNIGILGMILSYFIPHPYIGESLLWFSWGYLFLKSRSYKYERIFIFIIIGYIFLFIIQIIFNYQNLEWLMRLYGLTKNMMMFGLMMLVWPLINKGTVALCELIIVIFTSLYIIQPTIVTSYVSANGVAALFVVLLPISLYKLVYEQRFVNIVGIVLLLPLSILIDSETFYIILQLELALLSFFFLTAHWKSSRNIRLLINWILAAAIIISVFELYMIMTDASYYQRALDFMLRLNRDRAYIWSWGFTQFSGRDLFSYIFGGGDNHVQMQYVLQAGHNALLEELLIYGVCGLLLFFVELWALYKTIYKKITTKREQYFAIAVAVGAYVEFLAHPFYSTYFILKIIYI